MNFNYETQGAITYLVCELDSDDQLDNLTLGMLTNNHIAGLAPVLYTEMDGHRFLKYNVSAKVTASRFFGGNMSRQRALQAFRSILNALCSADDYMIEQNCFSVDPEHVFLNVSNCEAALICLPVVTDRDICTETAELFRQILFRTRFDTSDSSDLIAQMLSCLNSGPDFTVYGLRDLVCRMAGDASDSIGAPSSGQPASVQPNRAPAPPASPFDSTISIDDMPTSMGGRQQTPAQGMPAETRPSVQPQLQVRRPVPVQPQTPVQPQVQIPVQPQVQVQRPATSTQPPIPPKQQPAVPQVQKTVTQGERGFAIPGQGPSGIATAGRNPVARGPVPQQPAAQVRQPVPPTAPAQKKMSFFGLMMHYNKENAAIYKAQKEAEKKQPKGKQTVPPNQPAGYQPPQAQGPQPGYPSRQGMPAGGAQGVGAAQGYATPVQPIPVQNRFNETTVLSAVGGETTVLSEAPTAIGPILTRVKTGERVAVNKPVFRIGKEKSYVDFFIADNTAISRSHCNIYSENGEYFIEDTNSTNHTYVNDRLIPSNVKTKLTSGDRVKLANEEFTFSV